jgi:type I restriction enzyme S subunit
VTFPLYEKYRDSRIEWLGTVPSDWRIVPIKAVATCNDDVLPETTADDHEILYVEISGVDAVRGIVEVLEMNFAEAPSRARRLVRDGDVLVSTVRTYLRAIAPVVEPPDNLIVSTGFAVLRPREIYSTFLSYLLRSEFLISCIISRSVGVSYPAINASDIMRLPIAIPKDISEQMAISKFLDRETAKIDALVAEQEKLIVLLKEKCQAVISHAVTKGLDPKVKMKDSGIEWFGKIPSHWRVVPLMHLTDPQRPIMYGIVLPGPDMDDGILIVKGGDVKEHRLRPENLCKTTPEIEAPFARARLRENDIVYSIRGTIGDAELVPASLENANITQDVARVSPRNDVNCYWLLSALRSDPVFQQLRQRSLGAAVPGINIFDLKRARIPVPPPDEQNALAEFLVDELAKLVGLIAEARKSIDLLKEHRAALISAAVTGKIDVRGLAGAEAA